MSSVIKDHGIVEKMEDLTESMCRTTDVLSTADRMIDHYRDLNTEQEYVIAKLKKDLEQSTNDNKIQNEIHEELQQTNREKIYKNVLNTNQDNIFQNKHPTIQHKLFENEYDAKKIFRESKRKIIHESSSDISSEDCCTKSNLWKKKSTHSTKDRLQDTTSKADYEIEILKTSLNDVKRKQDTLEVNFKKDRQLHDEEIDRLDSTLRKQLSLDFSKDNSQQMNKDNSQQMNNDLKKLQLQIEEDRMEYNKQQKEMLCITQDMKSLKDVIQETTVKKKPETFTRFDQSLESDRKLTLYKKKVIKQVDTIKLLKEKLKEKTNEARGCETTVDKMQSLGKMKSQQLKILEQQLNEEKCGRLKIFRDFEETQCKLGEANKERSELLYHISDLKQESQTNNVAYEQTSRNITQLKALLEESEKQKEQLSGKVNNLNNELQVNNNLVSKMKSQLSDYAPNLGNLESEKQTLANQVEEIRSKYYDIKNELDSTKEMLLEAKRSCKCLEESRQEVKERTLNTLREYHNKCKKFEKQTEDAVKKQKANEIELSKAVSQSNEQEITNLKLKNELQDNTNQIEKLQKIILESENKCNQLLYEKSQLEDALSQTNDKTNTISVLQREMQELKNEKQAINLQLSEEKHKREEFQSLLHERHEKNVTSKDENYLLKRQFEEEKLSLKRQFEEECTSLKRQLKEESSKLQEERNNRMQTAINVKEECRSTSEEKIKDISNVNENLIKKLKYSEENLKQATEGYKDAKRKLKQKEIEGAKEIEKSNLLTQKLKKLTEENKKIRKQFEITKQHFDEKLKSAQSDSSSLSKEQNILVQKDVNKVHTVEIESNIQSHNEANNGISKIINILLQDIENLLNLLSYEEENVPRRDVVSCNIFPGHEKAIVDIREKYQTCYSITKTLKGRFQQQKVLIKRAQQKIKSQIEQIENLTLSCSEHKQNQEKIASLEALGKTDKEKIITLETIRRENEEKIISLETNRKKNEGKIISLKTLSKGDAGKINSLKTMNESAEKKIAFLETSRKNDQEKVASLETAKINVEKKITSLITLELEYQEKIASLENVKNKDEDLIAKMNKEILVLKSHMMDLTKDLEGCTRALHKSIEIDKERKAVLNEIELLKTEHKERQKIDENFFRCTEKIELLTEQLNEAKHSLSEIKQDSVDRCEVTNRIIETFGSVSPSRKRRLYLYDSPLFSSSFAPNDYVLPSYIGNEGSSPTKDIG